MLANFLKTSARVLWKRKVFSFINIMGLAIGIAASLLLFLVIKNEITFDDFHKNRDRIYRITTTVFNKSNNEIKHRYAAVPYPMPATIRQEFPQLEKTAGIWSIGQAQFYIPAEGGLTEERRFKETEGLFWSEREYFDIFDFDWKAGNASRLNEPNTAVISESLAKKFFDNTANAMGKTIQMWSFRIPFQVVGVFADLPDNTDQPVRIANSSKTLESRMSASFEDPQAWGWVQGNCQQFILTKPGQQVAALQKQLNSFQQKYYPNDPLTDTRLSLQPLSSMHLDKRFETYRNDGLSKTQLWSLGLIGGFLLLVACINFINLATAQSINRAKEIGVRKVLGGNRSQLTWQFLRETGFLTFIAVLAGLLIAFITVPALATLMRKNISINLIQDPAILLYLFLTGILVTFLAGIYPALVLSGFKPVVIFRKKIDSKMVGGISLRRGLVIFQFVIAQLLIIGTLVVVKQMSFLKNQPLGYDTDGIAVINLPSDSALQVKYPLLKSRMEQIPGVEAVSLCMNAPTDDWAWFTDFIFDNDPERRDFPISAQFADTSYYRTFGISLVGGRLPFASDTANEFVINEALMHKLGFSTPDEVIGKGMGFGGWTRKSPIVGVVKDFNNRSLREAITPMAMTTEYNTYEWIAVRMERSNIKNTMEKVKALFSGIYPSYMFDPYFFDQRIERFYENERVTSSLFQIFAILAIVISCLGLYGLISFMAIQKTREVGIRKVLGASVRSIVFMFSRELIILIIVAFVLSAPIGIYFMQKWLNGFHYHTNIGWGIIVSAIFISIAIAWATVSYKALKAALVNPVKSLKTE